MMFLAECVFIITMVKGELMSKCLNIKSLKIIILSNSLICGGGLYKMSPEVQ